MAARQAALRFALTRPFQAQFRTSMSTSAAAAAVRKFEFLVIVPDKPGVKEKRLQVRPQHVDNLKSTMEAGGWKMGGALLNELPQDDDASKFDFLGSTFVVEAESKEEVLNKLKTDIYVASGVWDLEKAQIYPLKCAFRRE